MTLKFHVLDELYRHSSNVAHGVEVPAGARLLFTNGQVGTKPDGISPEATLEQAEVVFTRLAAVLSAASMAFLTSYDLRYFSLTAQMCPARVRYEEARGNMTARVVDRRLHFAAL